MARSRPPKDYILSAILGCDDCTQRWEVFLFYEDENINYFDIDPRIEVSQEDSEQAVENYIQEENPTCPNCGSDAIECRKC